MKRLIFTGVIAMALTAGCAKAGHPSMTQPIAVTTAQVQPGLSEPEGSGAGVGAPAGQGEQSGIPASESAPASEEAVTETAAGAVELPSMAEVTGDTEKDRESYYRVKAEKEAAELDIHILEAAFRVGGVDQESFHSQKRALKEQEDWLDMQEDMLEDAVEHSYYREQPLPQGDIDSLLGQLRQAKIDKHTADKQCDLLEDQYRAGQISREEFVAQYQDAARQEDEADVREELLEDALDMLGWDD